MNYLNNCIVHYSHHTSVFPDYLNQKERGEQGEADFPLLLIAEVMCSLLVPYKREKLLILKVRPPLFKLILKIKH